MHLALGWAVFSLSTVAVAADLEEVRKAGRLRVVVADESAETFARAAGPAPGFERELIEGFARLQGVELEVVTAPGHADRIPLLLRGGGDASPPRPCVCTSRATRCSRRSGRSRWRRSSCPCPRRDRRARAPGTRRAIANARRGPTRGRLIAKYFGAQALTVLGRAR